MRQSPPSRLDDGYPILTGAFCRSGPKLFPKAALCQEPEEESGLESLLSARVTPNRIWGL